MVKKLVNDQSGNQCFGCSPYNDRGLRLTFSQNDDGTIESRIEVPAHLVGPPGTVHGGIQGVLLDEVMGMAANISLETEATLAVTAELRLKYRRPVPVGQTLLVRGRLVRTADSSMFVSGEILGPEQDVLTEAEARFKAVESGPAQS
jgi:uncharacterized protein (TIGR00369 family)